MWCSNFIQLTESENELSKQIEISVIIPTLNSEGSLPTLFRTLDIQTFRDFEVVVTDSGSSDSTLELCKAADVTVIEHQLSRNETRNPAAARNLGAQRANGKTLLFLDSDMELTKHVLMSCHNLIKTHDALCIREDVPLGNYWATSRGLEKKFSFGSLIFEAARCFRRNVFFEIGGYDERLTSLEDVGLQFTLLERGYEIGWVHEPIIHHEEEIGLFSYLHKRKRFIGAFKPIRETHPEYWAIFTSPFDRASLIVNGLRRERSLGLLMFLPGLLVTRGLEFFLRSQ